MPRRVHADPEPLGRSRGVGRLGPRSTGSAPPVPPREVSTLSPFTVEAASALPGPDWLRAHRAEAAERFTSSGLPSADEEVWRYSRIADLDLGAWTPAGRGAGAAAPTDAFGEPAVSVVVEGGTVTVGDLPSEWVDQGVVVSAASDLPTADLAGLGAVAAGGPDVFAVMNDAFTVDPVVVSVPAGVQLDGAVLVSHRYAGAGTAHFPRLVVRVGRGARATVVAHHLSGDDAVWTVPLTELDVGPGARLAYLDVQELGSSSWQIGSLVARVDQEADLRAGLVGLGGGYARLRTDCRLAGRGANGDLLAAYFGDGDQTLDFRTFQYHDAPDTTSNLLFKGAVAGHSRSVYTGLIRVDKAARGTNAFQTNRNVKLSDDAWAESVPNLEIETNDVRCSHASTVGPVDPEQRFYLESRGVPPQQADRLIVAGFFDEVVRQLPGHGATARVQGLIERKLDAIAGELR